jgi:hypothetical protein
MMGKLRVTLIALPVLWNHHSLPVNDTLPGAENVRRTEARGLGTGAEDRQSMRYSTTNHMCPRRMTPGPQEVAGGCAPTQQSATLSDFSDDIEEEEEIEDENQGNVWSALKDFSKKS